MTYQGFCQDKPTLEEVRSWIEKEGLHWTAGETSISNLPIDKISGYLGALEEKETPTEYYNFTVEGSLPSSWSSFVSPVKDQLGCGVCWIFGTIASFETFYSIVNLDLSEQFLVDKALDCVGGLPQQAADWLIMDGTPEEWCRKFCGGNQSNCSFNRNDACVIPSQYFYRNFYNLNWGYINGNSISALKSAIYDNGSGKGSVIASMEVFSDFLYYSGGVYQASHNEGNCWQGSHIVQLYGWVDDPTPGYGGGYFLGKNSWGTDWGENGKFKIAYNQISDSWTNHSCWHMDKPPYYTCIPSGCDWGAGLADLSLSFIQVKNAPYDFFSVYGNILNYYNAPIKNGKIDAYASANYKGFLVNSGNTNSEGNYSIGMLPNLDTYKLVPSESTNSSNFEPSVQYANINGGNVSNLNFLAKGKHQVKCNAYFNNGTPMENVKLIITGELIRTNNILYTNSSGEAIFPYLQNGTYKVKAEKEGIVFVNNEIEFTINNSSINITFTEQNKYFIKGNVYYNGNEIIHQKGPMQSVGILVNGNDRGIKTGNDGSYEVDGLYPGTYKVEPVYYDSNGYRWSFEPPYQIVTITNSNVENVNFEVKTHMIDGWMTTDLGLGCNYFQISLKILLNGLYHAETLSSDDCFYQILGLPNGYYTIRADNFEGNHHCFSPDTAYQLIIDDFTQQDANKHGINFMVYISNIEGYVKEIIHDHNKNGDPITTTNYIEGAKVEILEKNQFDITNSSGHYGFANIVSNLYNLKATKTITLPDGETYTKTYNPNPRQVYLCATDALNQDFYMNVFVMDKPPMQIAGRLDLNMDLSITSFVASSADYWTEVKANSLGYAEIPLPQGTYNVYAIKECNTFYPPYLTITVSEFQEIPVQNFEISGWSICDRCYATLYTEQNDCMNRIDKYECLEGAKLRFRNCISLKTNQANSQLYNAIVLSVQVNRSTGKPEEFIETFEVQEEGDYFVNVTNGDYFNKKTVVSSAEINIEGFGQIFGPSDFNKNVFHLKKQIHLTPGQYQISSILRSQPDSYLTIVISNKDISSFIELP